MSKKFPVLLVATLLIVMVALVVYFFESRAHQSSRPVSDTVARALIPAEGNGNNRAATGGDLTSKGSASIDPKPMVISGLAPNRGAYAIPEANIAPVNAMKIHSTNVLATVNGKAIRLGDLVPLGENQEDVEYEMDMDRYDFLLGDAIERELTFQAAERQGVEVSALQLEHLQTKLDNEFERLDAIRGDKNVMWTSLNSDQIDRKNLIGYTRMLQRQLALHNGGPSIYPTGEQVQQYFAANRHKYGPLPANPAERDAVWKEIESKIRMELAMQFEREYQQWLSKYLTQLKAQANIQVTSTN